MNLSIKKAFALSITILWGLGLFLMTWWIIAFDGISTEKTLLSRCYRGYSYTAIGFHQAQGGSSWQPVKCTLVHGSGV